MTPQQAIAAARQAKGFTKAPSAVGREREQDSFEDLVQLFRVGTPKQKGFAFDARRDDPGTPTPIVGKADLPSVLRSAQRVARNVAPSRVPKGGKVTVTKNGAVQIRDAKGRVRSTVRPAARDTTGRFASEGAIKSGRAPKGRDRPVEYYALPRVVRIVKGGVGRGTFRVSEAQLNAGWEAYKRDRHARGWPATGTIRVLGDVVQLVDDDGRVITSTRRSRTREWRQ